jgi:hypothetical protein
LEGVELHGHALNAPLEEVEPSLRPAPGLGRLGCSTHCRLLTVSSTQEERPGVNKMVVT